MDTIKSLSVEELQTLDLTSVNRSYRGKPHCCRCGCLGKYSETKHIAKLRFEKMIELGGRGCPIQLSEDQDWINVNSEHICYTLYATPFQQLNFFSEINPLDL